MDTPGHRLLLAINVGNTHTAIAAMKGRQVRERSVVTTASVATEGVESILSRLESVIGLSLRWDGAAMASVVPVATEIWREALEHLGVSLLIVDGECAPGLNVGVDEPRRAGPDRIANALGLLGKYGCPAIAVDAGTATTLDVVDGMGTFVGGAIAAGAGTSLRALSDYTARLPLLRLPLPSTETPVAIGRDTERAMMAGALLGHAGLIDRLVEETRRELGSSAVCVLTGGLASILAPHCRTVDVIDSDLTLLGLAYAWEKFRVS